MPGPAFKIPDTFKTGVPLVDALVDQLVADPLGGMGPTPLVATLPKGLVLNNLLNHVRDLKGTRYNDMMAFLAERYPRVMGHLEKISVSKKQPGPGLAGSFEYDDQLIGPGKPIGEIKLAKDYPKDGLMSPSKEPLDMVFAHEAAHAGQALRLKDRMGSLYDRNPLAIEGPAENLGWKVYRDFEKWMKSGKQPYRAPSKRAK